jgi:hypothetical protein
LTAVRKPTTAAVRNPAMSSERTVPRRDRKSPTTGPHDRSEGGRGVRFAPADRTPRADTARLRCRMGTGLEPERCRRRRMGFGARPSCGPVLPSASSNRAGRQTRSYLFSSIHRVVTTGLFRCIAAPFCRFSGPFNAFPRQRCLETSRFQRPIELNRHTRSRRRARIEGDHTTAEDRRQQP